MKRFCTILKALDPKDGMLKTWRGPDIEAINWEYAVNRLDELGLGYLEIDGELIEEIAANTDIRFKIYPVCVN